MITTRDDNHLTDDGIVRALDDQLAPAEAHSTRLHLDACVQCSHRLAQLRHRQQQLSLLLRRTDPPVPHAVPPVLQPAVPQPVPSDIEAACARSRGRSAWTERPWLRIAAGITLLMGAALTFSPVRAAVGAWLMQQWSQLTGDVTSLPEPAAVPLGSRVDFVPTAGDFVVEFAAPQAAGSLTVRRGADSSASLEASRTGVELLVLPAGVRISNTADGGTSYDVVVPPSVSSVSVVIGGRTVTTLTGAALAAGASLPVR